MVAHLRMAWIKRFSGFPFPTVRVALPWWPCHLPAPQKVKVKVVHGLTAFLSIIYNKTVAIVELFLLCNNSRSVHKFSENSLVVLPSFRKLRQPISDCSHEQSS